MAMMQLRAQPGLIVVQTTLDDPKVAKALARSLVEARVAACVQISSIESTYVWQGQTEVAVEQLLTIKTASDRLNDLTATISREHPYDEPEFIVLPVLSASEGYTSWIEGSVSQTSSPK
ncbi:MAG: divalent-cation tolerance protein CutA [Pseudomonadota bacterium]